MHVCTDDSICAVLTPSLREDFCPKHKDCVYIMGYIAVHHRSVASSHEAACGDVLVCIMILCTLFPWRRKPWCRGTEKELKHRYAGHSSYGTRCARHNGDFTTP